MPSAALKLWKIRMANSCCFLKFLNLNVLEIIFKIFVPNLCIRQKFFFEGSQKAVSQEWNPSQAQVNVS